MSHAAIDPNVKIAHVKKARDEKARTHPPYSREDFHSLAAVRRLDWQTNSLMR